MGRDGDIIRKRFATLVSWNRVRGAVIPMYTTQLTLTRGKVQVRDLDLLGIDKAVTVKLKS
ncbi:MAG: hypothetical protein OWR62_14535, partial [Sulfobacillus thermotolerans]|nr:hypothetical protein [Sulfobacillus thermotolerans]